MYYLILARNYKRLFRILSTQWNVSENVVYESNRHVFEDIMLVILKQKWNIYHLEQYLLNFKNSG